MNVEKDKHNSVFTRQGRKLGFSARKRMPQTHHWIWANLLLSILGKREWEHVPVVLGKTLLLSQKTRNPKC